MRLLVLVLVLLPFEAFADAPYFGKNTLCEGEGWSVHLLFGDGILGPDPAAAVVLDDMGHILAYQSLGPSPFRLMGKECRVWSWYASKGYSPSPTDFDQGPLLLGDRDETREARWAYEPSYGKAESFGFVPVGEDVSSALVLISEARSWWRGIVFFALLGLVPAALVFATVGSVGTGWARPIGFAIGAVIAMAVWGILLLFLAAFGDMSPGLALTIALVQSALLILAGGLRARRKTPATY